MSTNHPSSLEPPGPGTTKQGLPDLALLIQPTTTVTHLRVRVAMLSDPGAPPPSPQRFQVLAWRKLHFDETQVWVAESNEGNNWARFPAGASFLRWT